MSGSEGYSKTGDWDRSEHDDGVDDDSREPEIPKQIGRYRIQDMLGRGGFGFVFRAWDEELNRVVAVKIPRRSAAGKPSSHRGPEAYLKEARHVARLEHNNIVPVYDIQTIEETGDYCIVSRLIDGNDLHHRMRHRRMTFRQTAELVAAIAEALHFAHEHGVVHRDVKPSNILLDKEGVPYITDFGLAVRYESAELRSEVVGTPSYMSPEQALGEGHRIDGRSDIFSLGIVLYEMVTGQLPFSGDSTVDLLQQITLSEPAPPRQIDHRIPREIERICLRCLARRAGDRYASADELAVDLRHFTEHGVSSGRPKETTEFSVGTPKSSSDASASQSEIRVIPKGLRSFDSHDADFFIRLLPGPRDREGLPAGLRFWRTWMESESTATSHTVGLIYGPSGCGKTSLVKAGLLPNLGAAVVPIYFEARRVGTEARLLSELRNRFPQLQAKSLPDLFFELRRGTGLGTNTRVILIIDQFEQWLHGQEDLAAGELTRALRQCDGRNLKTILMVRDDFWLSISRFMRELEVPLVEGENSAMVDLFDVIHARRVLTAFGRAFDKLPPFPERLSGDQEWFLTQAVAELASDGKVVSVRIALLAEMLRDKEWDLATLQAMGGTAGVGEAFLTDVFDSPSAPPLYRLHQDAIRQVLAALLPPADFVIRGQSRSRRQLMVACGYADRTGDFDELIRILDNETRLITPADEPEQQDRDDDIPYQLTHDYLVPSLRGWLTRRQQESRRGRAELLLEQRADFWDSRPEGRNLPSFWEWASIRTLSQPKTWSAGQRSMMKSASRYYLFRVVAVAVLLVTGIGLGWVAMARLRAGRARDLAQQLMDGDVRQAPTIVAKMEKLQRWCDAELDRRLAQPNLSVRDRLKLSLAAVHRDHSHVDFLVEQLLVAPAVDFPTLRDALADHLGEKETDLWHVASSDDETSDRKFRACVALAAYQPRDARWRDMATEVTSALLGQDRLHLSTWIQALRPVKAFLVPELKAHLGSPDDPKMQTAACATLKDYLSDDAADYAELLLAANPIQYAELIDFPEAIRGAIRTAAKRESQPPLPTKPEPRRISAELKDQLATVGGTIGDGFALCQRAAWDELQSLNKSLQTEELQIRRCRPFQVQDKLFFAAVWAEGPLATIASGIDDTALNRRNVENEKRGLVLSDLARYVHDGQALFAAVWVPRPKDVQSVHFELDVELADVEAMHAKRKRTHRVRSLQGNIQNGREVFSILWWKTTMAHSNDEDVISRLELAARIPTDIDARTDRGYRDSRIFYDQQWQRANRAVQDNDENWRQLWKRAEANLATGKHSQALQDLERLSKSQPQAAVWTTQPDAGFTTQLARTGSNAAELRSRGKPTWVEQRIKVKPHTNYLVTAWVRTASTDGKKADAAAAGSTVFLTASSPRIASHPVASPGKWAKIRLRFNSQIWTSLSLRLNAQSDGGGDSIAWFDDVALHEIGTTSDPCNHIQNGGFEPKVPILEQYRARAHLAQKDNDRAAAVLAASPHNCLQPYVADCLRAVIAGRREGLKKGLAELATLRKSYHQNPKAMYWVARSHMMLAEDVSNAGDRERCIQLAYLAAQDSLAAGYSGGWSYQSADVFAPLRKQADHLALARLMPARKSPITVWRKGVDIEARTLVALPGREHQKRTAALAQDGFRPVNISVDPPTVAGVLRYSSVWHRRKAKPHKTIIEARRRANACILSALLSNQAPVWMLSGRNPVLADQCIHHVGAAGLDGQRTLDLLINEERPDIRRALVFWLAAIEDPGLEWRRAATSELARLVRDEPHNGLRSAAEWTLRKWGKTKELEEIINSLQKTRLSASAPWFVTRQGDILVVVDTHAEFLMGSPLGETPRTAEGRHRRRIGRRFAVATKEISVRQFEVFQQETGIRARARPFESPTEDCPKVGVTWIQAAAYCRWLSEKHKIPESDMCYPSLDVFREILASGSQLQIALPPDHLHRTGFRLPTEAEWEYMYRAGTTSPYFFGHDADSLRHYGWYVGNSDGRAWPVGSLKPNQLGMFDMVGNAREWCQSRFVPYPKHYLGQSTGDFGVFNPAAIAVRGGSFVSSADHLRASARLGDKANANFHSYGFRLARTMPDN